MNNLIKSILAAISGFLICYLLGAFFEASFNISLWDAGTRCFIAFIGLCFALMFFIYVHSQNNL